MVQETAPTSPLLSLYPFTTPAWGCLETTKTMLRSLTASAALLAAVPASLALSSHSPRDLESHPSFSVVLSEHHLLNDTLSDILSEPLEVRFLFSFSPSSSSLTPTSLPRRLPLTPPLPHGTSSAPQTANLSSAPSPP